MEKNKHCFEFVIFLNTQYLGPELKALTAW